MSCAQSMAFTIPPSRRRHRPLVLAASVAGAVFAAAAAAGDTVPSDRSAPRTLDFRRDVRPILSDKCLKCHGPDEEAREADLRLDARDSAARVLAPSKDGGESELVRRITHLDPGERMPPPESKLALSEAEVATLRRWVAEGAPYARHWAFEPPRRPPAPAVREASWPRGPIDAFVLSRLELEGLRPAPEAPRERLFRRVSFDLTGLPPTLEEVDAFLEDDSAGAYEKVVERLLARPAHAERMAAEWLDAARYSDSYGYQVDRDRFVWPWRDWVIEAFLRGLRYDEFITLQLAGDLLPGASDEDVLATTFSRLHGQEVEGGSVPEEYRVEYVADRTRTFATAFLGLSLECARCHDHKYDPLSQREYYQVFAFFNSIDEAGLYSYFTEAVPTPTLLLADRAAKERIAEAERRVAEAEAALAALRASRAQAFERWLEARPAAPEVPGRIAHLDFETPPAAPNRSVPGRHGRAVELTGDDGIGVGVGNFRRHEPFSVALWINTPDVKERAVVFHRSRAWTEAGSRGYELLIEEGRLSAALIHFWPGNAVRVCTRAAIPTGVWLHVAVTYDGSSRARGLRIYVDGREADCEVVRDQLSKEITGGGGDHITLGERFRDRGFTKGLADELQVFDRELTALEVAHLHDGESSARLLARPAAELTSRERALLFDAYLATRDQPYREGLTALRAAREALNRAIEPVPEIMVMRELPEPRPTHVLVRGAYNAPGERVAPGTPAALSPFPAGLPPNRLGLARWLTDAKHPLAARVAANRLWQYCWGHGLVRTPEDFGSQGEPPTHPELLDWLARELVETGWDTKRILFEIVSSAAYQQDSSASVDLERRDPENRLLARGPSHRLSAEMIRDNALAASGLLVSRIGGPPAKPYEVEASFKPMERDKGDGLYRRSLYTFWRRNGPAPAMLVLDASRREVCTVRRERTSSPLQALVLLNGPQFVEAARVLGERLAKAHGSDADGLVTEIFRRLTSRRPSDSERAVLRRLYDEELRALAEDSARAERFLETGDAPREPGVPPAHAAAAGMLANALFNFDECVMKR